MNQNAAMSDMYRQLEEVMKKCDSLSLKIENLNNTNKNEHATNINLEKKIVRMEIEINDLREENTSLIKRNEKLENEVDRLKKQINNDSNNSSNPPSSDIKKNIPNNRVKTNNKVGGQLGHKPHFLSKYDIEDKVKSGSFKHEVINIGNLSDKYVSKYIIDIEVGVTAKEYRFYVDKNGKYNIPKEFKNDVQYGSELKTMCTLLNTEGVIAIDRLTNFVKSLTHGKVSLSTGTVVNFISTLANKCKPTIERIKTDILNSELMYTDATTARCDNKNISVRNYSTTKETLLISTIGKGRKYIEETGILNNYVNDLIHDHETVMYRYGRNHGECNAHVTRYLTGCNDNTKNNWSTSMISFLCSLNRNKLELISKEIKSIDKEKLQKYSLRYDEILKKGNEQNSKVKSEYYRNDEKKLLRRLEKYKQNHLLFINDFDIPFDNNLSERDLRHVKNKQKISGYFRSMEGVQDYLDIKSIISTCKKRGLDFYKEIFNIYENKQVSV